MLDLGRVVGSDWDKGNARKNERHGVSQVEAEDVFFDPRLLMVPDPRHSTTEPRFHALGETSAGRRLHVTFTLRLEGTIIRVISARAMHRKERRSMKRKARAIPVLKSEAAERRFWEGHDSSPYVDWSKAARATFPNLKPTTKSISLRLPLRMLERIKAGRGRLKDLDLLLEIADTIGSAIAEPFLPAAPGKDEWNRAECER